jgi:exopolysaccharide production protein ExoQ
VSTGRKDRVPVRAPPDWPQLLSSASGFLATFCLYIVPLKGAVAVLLFLVAIGGLIVIRPADCLKGIVTAGPFFALPLFALLSAFWSEAPAITTRAGLQLLVTCIGGAIVARCCKTSHIILALYLGALWVCSTAIPQILWALQSGFRLHGDLGSKNAFANAAQTLELLALAIVFDRNQLRLVRLSGILIVPIALVLVALAQSAGAYVLTGIVLVLFPGLLAFGRLSAQARGSATLLMLAVVAVLGLLRSEIEALGDSFRSDVLHKDATLTGRTELWQIADREVAKRPVLGHGFSAYWRHGNIQVEKIWRELGIGSRMGFNFHNEFVEIKVDLGYVGLAIFVVLALTVLIAITWRQLTAPTFFTSFALTVLISTYIRLFAEITLLARFTVSCFLWFLFAGLAFAPNQQCASPRRRSGGTPGRRLIYEDPPNTLPRGWPIT